jgi:hypothetical protein
MLKIAVFLPKIDYNLLVNTAGSNCKFLSQLCTLPFVILSSLYHVEYSSPSIIRIIGSRRMRWTGNAARMGRREMYIGYCWES